MDDGLIPYWDEAMTSMRENLVIIGERLTLLQRENTALRKIIEKQREGHEAFGERSAPIPSHGEKPRDRRQNDNA